MTPLDFFNRHLTIEKVKLPAGARKEKSAELYARRAASVQSIDTITSGTDYAEEYIKREERNLYECALLSRTLPENQYDDVSLATAASHIDESTAEELTRIYRTYNFAYHARSNLTIKTVRDKIISTIEAEPVTIIQGPTGCGKTTQVPQFILDSCFEKKTPCNIIVTQPRRIAAISIAQRVCSERQWPLGSIVGYQVGLSRVVSQDTRLVFCTTGVLLARLINAKHMNDYTHVIIDEVHERDQDMDFLMLVVRKFLRSNSRTVKVILMSATFDVEKFSKYFSSYVGKNLAPAPVVDVTKSNYYDVSEFYLDDLTTIFKGGQPPVSFQDPKVSQQMIELSVRLIGMMDAIDDGKNRSQGTGSNPPAALIFLPGILEIEEMHKELTKQTSFKWDIVALHSSITSEEQNRIFSPPQEGHRRIILSTNIAESSITVPDIMYVVDFCLTKQLTTDASTNFHCLEMTWASKANCRQRAGRTGRVMDGRVYRLVPKNFYAALPNENLPEILTAPLESVILRTKMLDLDKPQALLALALDPPDLTNMERTILLLLEAGGLLAIEDERFDGELTDLGRIMAQLPLDIHITKMIVLGHVFSVLRESIIIGASMSVKNMFSTPFQKKLQAYAAKLTWAQNTASDCTAFLHAYNVWMREKANGRIKSNRDEIQWAQRHCLQIRVLREVNALIQDITERLKRLGIKETIGAKKVEWEETERNFVIKIIFAGGFYPQFFTTKLNTDDTKHSKLLGGLDPLKTVYLQGWPANQPAMLYAQHLQLHFDDCVKSQTHKIKVKSDNTSRVYVHFGKAVMDESHGSGMSSEVPLAVYLALKMRKIGNKLTVPVLPPDESLKKAEELHIKTVTPSSIFRKVNEEPTVPRTNEIRPALPSSDVSRVSLIFRQIINPAHFWVSVDDSEIENHYAEISNYIESEVNHERFDTPPTIGTLLLAPYEVTDKTKFCRALVQGIMMENKADIMVQVLFVDYGSIRRVRVSDLHRLPEDHPVAKIPGLAFECVLSNVRPSVFNTLTGGWSKEAKRTVVDLVKDKSRKFFGEIYSVVNSVVSITLICVDQSQVKTNINEYLIKKGYAEFCDEGYLSRENHDFRQRASRFSAAEKSNREEMQYNQFDSTDSYVSPPPKDECKLEVSLKGPFSPLEVELNSVTTAAMGRKVRIADESVNSILLDETLVNPRERLLVAGLVGQSASTGNLILRNTALMPNIPGLTSFLSLIFAPQIELRRNVYKTRYTGALCGLGYDKKTHRSLFPEHDMPISFDVEVTIDDLQNVNRLRHWMSAGIFITTDDTDVSEDIAICQNKVKDILFRIIYTERESMPYEADLLRDQWCRYEKHLFLAPGTVTQVRQNIFKLHHALDLEERNESLEKMIEHLNELRNLAAESFHESTLKTISCKLCNEDIFGILRLRTHLNSAEHRTREFQYRCV